jgi:hypothetical protein
MRQNCQIARLPDMKIGLLVRGSNTNLSKGFSFPTSASDENKQNAQAVGHLHRFPKVAQASLLSVTMTLCHRELQN